MYGLPKDFDGACLVGRVLRRICFGLYQVQLHFDERVTIAVESTFLYKEPSAPDFKAIDIPDLPAAQSDLLRLLDHKVVNAFGDQEGTLVMQFDDGRTLHCLDDEPYYEAYKIALGDEEIIV